MTRTRPAEWTVTALIAAGVVALIGAALTAPRYGLDTSAPNWRAWAAMSAAERSANARLLDDVTRREDGARILAHARAFAALSNAEQARLRRVERALRDALNSPHAAAFRNAVPEGQPLAVAALRIMEAHFPAQLAALRETQPAGE